MGNVTELLTTPGTGLQVAPETAGADASVNPVTRLGYDKVMLLPVRVILRAGSVVELANSLLATTRSIVLALPSHGHEVAALNDTSAIRTCRGVQWIWRRTVFLTDEGFLVRWIASDC